MRRNWITRETRACGGLVVTLAALVISCPLAEVSGHDGQAMTPEEKSEIRDQILEMFDHAYNSYMDYAYPADELMPLSCRGRVRGLEPNRGDVDDSLGKFSLTLIDTLDTLVLLNKLDEFEEAVKKIMRDVRLDNDIVVSVFETNIRVLGGLLGAHVMADVLKQRGQRMQWYRDELLHMAKELGYRLLPAFNTTSGLPYPRVNLRYGVVNPLSRTGTESDTCTACAGTLILEFAAHQDDLFSYSCPSAQTLFPNNPTFAKTIRDGYKYLTGVGRAQQASSVRGIELPLHDTGLEPVEFLKSMGISLTPLTELVSASQGSVPQDSQKGVFKLKLVAEVSQTPEHEEVVPLIVQLISPPFLGRTVLMAGPAKFGLDLTKQEHGVKGRIMKSVPYTACGPIENTVELQGHIALALRGDCMFAAKARRLQEAGAIGVIFIDHREGSSSAETPLFQMVGDGEPTDDITVPLVFLFSKEGATLTAALQEHHNVDVLLLPKERQLGKEKPEKLNIKFRLAKEGELEDGEMESTTIQLVLEQSETATSLPADNQETCTFPHKDPESSP